MIDIPPSRNVPTDCFIPARLEPGIRRVQTRGTFPVRWGKAAARERSDKRAAENHCSVPVVSSRSRWCFARSLSQDFHLCVCFFYLLAVMCFYNPLQITSFLPVKMCTLNYVAQKFHCCLPTAKIGTFTLPDQGLSRLAILVSKGPPGFQKAIVRKVITGEGNR